MQIRFKSSIGKGEFTIWIDGTKRVASVSGLTFAILDAAFAKDRVCITQSAGPVICVELSSGMQIWKYEPPEHQRVLSVGYSEKLECFHGFPSLSRSGANNTLLRFDFETGKRTHVADLSDHCHQQRFYGSGRYLVTTSGEVIDVQEGSAVKRFKFR